MKLGHKSVQKLVDFLGDLKAQKFHSEIKWPLNVIQVNSQKTMQIIGKQSQHQTSWIPFYKQHHLTIITI